MRRSVRRLKEYEKIEFDVEKVIAASKKLKSDRKVPTSIALERKTVAELKLIAAQKGVPYQVLMRMLLLEGLKNLKKAA